MHLITTMPLNLAVTTPGRVRFTCSFTVTRSQQHYITGALASIVEFCHQSGSSSIQDILLRKCGKGVGVEGLGSSI